MDSRYWVFKEELFMPKKPPVCGGFFGFTQLL
jgi:hypothetical protein